MVVAALVSGGGSEVDSVVVVEVESEVESEVEVVEGVGVGAGVPRGVCCTIIVEVVAVDDTGQATVAIGEERNHMLSFALIQNDKLHERIF